MLWAIDDLEKAAAALSRDSEEVSGGGVSLRAWLSLIGGSELEGAGGHDLRRLHDAMHEWMRKEPVSQWK